MNMSLTKKVKTLEKVIEIDIKKLKIKLTLIGPELLPCSTTNLKL